MAFRRTTRERVSRFSCAFFDRSECREEGVAAGAVSVIFRRMNHCLRLLGLFAALLAPALLAAEKSQPPAEKKAVAPKRYPLRGVITSVQADRSALMVKHEEIPGVMRAMTMLFKVDAATLKSVQKGQTITGMMSREGTDWVLHDVKVVPEKKS
jgi:Cu/Ag efflux protein CusF